MSKQLKLETRFQIDATSRFNVGPTQFILTPFLSSNWGSDYWSYRVVLTKTQAVVGFPKFTTIGIGFAKEKKSGNTNLPYSVEAEQIYEHIKVNKGSAAILKENCILAIQMIQAVACQDKKLGKF